MNKRCLVITLLYKDNNGKIQHVHRVGEVSQDEFMLLRDLDGSEKLTREWIIRECSEGMDANVLRKVCFYDPDERFVMDTADFKIIHEDDVADVCAHHVFFLE